MSIQEEQLEARLVPVRKQLAEEFPSVPSSEIDVTLSKVVTQLRASARIVSFLPVLALRFSRERLEVRQDAAPPRAA